MTSWPSPVRISTSSVVAAVAGDADVFYTASAAEFYLLGIVNHTVGVAWHADPCVGGKYAGDRQGRRIQDDTRFSVHADPSKTRWSVPSPPWKRTDPSGMVSMVRRSSPVLPLKTICPPGVARRFNVSAPAPPSMINSVLVVMELETVAPPWLK